MNRTPGWYSIMQYVPDPARMEAANVGVVLLCPERIYLESLTCAGTVRRMFGIDSDERVRLDFNQRAVRERLKREGIRSREDLDAFAGKLANDIRLTPPRAVRVEDPDRTLQQLFDELVGRKSRDPKPKAALEAVRRTLSALDLAPLLVRDVAVTVPAFGKELRADFAFQNGRFHLIEPVDFPAKGTSAETKACRLAAEGRSLFGTPHPDHHDMRLVVVGDPPADAAETAERILADGQVRLVRTASLPELADEIRRTAKPVGKRG